MAVRIARITIKRHAIKLIDARIALIVFGSAMLCVSLLLQSLQINFVPALAISGISFLVISQLIGSSREKLLGITLLFMLLSAASFAFFRFNAPLGGEYPLFAHLAYATFGMLMEEINHDNTKSTALVLLFGFVVGIAGVFTMLTQPDSLSPAMLMTPHMRFISPVSHSGGLLNVIGNLGLATYVTAGMHLLCRVPILRTALKPLAAAGISGATVYALHVIISSVALADFSKLSPYSPPSFTTISPKDGNHLWLITFELLFFLAVCPL